MFLKSNALPRLDLSNILLSWKEKELHWKHNSNLNPYQQCFTVMYPDIFGGYFFSGGLGGGGLGCDAPLWILGKALVRNRQQSPAKLQGFSALKSLACD